MDTYKSGVAEAAAQAGADLINDIWGLKYDPHMSEVIAKSGWRAVSCITGTILSTGILWRT